MGVTFSGIETIIVESVVLLLFVLGALRLVIREVNGLKDELRGRRGHKIKSGD